MGSSRCLQFLMLARGVPLPDPPVAPRGATTRPDPPTWRLLHAREAAALWAGAGRRRKRW
eukprot:10895411-Alexandrium_andersonii.AAC.1